MRSIRDIAIKQFLKLPLEWEYVAFDYFPLQDLMVYVIMKKDRSDRHSIALTSARCSQEDMGLKALQEKVDKIFDVTNGIENRNETIEK